MGFAIKAQIWFAGENHENKDYTLLDDLEVLEGARRETPRFLVVKDRFEVFDEGYQSDVDTHVYNFYFASQWLFENFVVESFDISNAEGVMISHDQEFAGLDTTIYVTNDEDIYNESRSNVVREQKPIFFLVKEKQIIGERGFEETFIELATVSQRLRETMEDAMFNGAGETSEKVVSVLDIHNGISGVPFFDISEDKSIIIGARVRDKNELISLVAASFGNDSYIALYGDDEFIHAKIYQGEDYITLDQVYGEDVIPESYRNKEYTYMSMSQSFGKWNVPNYPLDKSYDEGIRRAAELFGFCVIIDIPYEDDEGDIVGYMRNRNNELEPIRFPYIDTDEDDL